MADSEKIDDLIPAFQFGEPNKSVRIAEDEARIKDKNGKVLGCGIAEVRLDLLPKPWIHVHVTFQEELDTIKKLMLTKSLMSAEVLELKNHELQIKGTPKTIRGSSIVWFPYSYSIIGVGNDSTEIHHLVFHLFNFKKIFGTSQSVEKRGTKHHSIKHVNLEANNWIVELRSLAESEDNFNKLEDEGGYGLTHIGSLKKIDQTPFSGKDATDMLNMLSFFFSFAKGAWCKPICAIGFDSLGNRVWESWSSPTELWFSPQSWFDELNPKQIEDLFPCFLNRLTNENWLDAFNEVIYWYFSANNSSMTIQPEPGIILTQTALERLSFEYAVKERRLIEAGGFKDLRASDKFRLLFSSLDIPIEISGNTPELKKLAKQFNWLDTPHAMTEIRNSLVHPEHKRRGQFNSALFETWNLSLWYLELALLRLCGYSGTYRNRLSAEWVGQVEDVPWIKQEGNGKPED